MPRFFNSLKADSALHALQLVNAKSTLALTATDIWHTSTQLIDRNSSHGSCGVRGTFDSRIVPQRRAWRRIIAVECGNEYPRDGAIGVYERNAMTKPDSSGSYSRSASRLGCTWGHIGVQVCLRLFANRTDRSIAPTQTPIKSASSTLVGTVLAVFSDRMRVD